MPSFNDVENQARETIAERIEMPLQKEIQNANSRHGTMNKGKKQICGHY